jgi:hypothetical protein
MVTSGQHVGFQLQAGHAIALHVLWKLHTAARYGNHPASVAGARATFRADLLMYLTTQYASTPGSQRDRFWARWLFVLSPSLGDSSFTLLH